MALEITLSLAEANQLAAALSEAKMDGWAGLLLKRVREACCSSRPLEVRKTAIGDKVIAKDRKVYRMVEVENGELDAALAEGRVDMAQSKGAHYEPPPALRQVLDLLDDEWFWNFDRAKGTLAVWDKPDSIGMSLRRCRVSFSQPGNYEVCRRGEMRWIKAPTAEKAVEQIKL